MEKKQAQEFIHEVLNSRFDEEQFVRFIKELLNDYEIKNNPFSGSRIPEKFRKHIAHYKRIGKYIDPEGELMDVLIVHAKSVSKLERTRTALRNFVVHHMKNFEKQYALVAFYSKEDDGADWRLSLVKIDYESQKNEEGKIKIREDLVPAKRFSYLVGEHEHTYTAQKQLLPLIEDDHSKPLIVKEKDGDRSIESAFSIETVTDEFYKQYKELYLTLTENEEFTDALQMHGQDPVRFVKKLLGQIVFLYFLQKKGWLGVPKERKMGQGSKRFLQDRFEKAMEEGKNYFNDFLRYLFYEALAKEHNDEGIKHYYKKLSCKIPFLNGGLFEAEYKWDTADIQIPNDLFRNEQKNKAGDKGTGILEVFDRYNFTIREDEPLEKEVAVDPEMLGKVFENMLEITERKSKGAYYTPREIVHYMCQESLIHYLDNTLNEYTESYQAIDTDQTYMFGGSTDKKGTLKMELENKGDIRVPKEDIEQFIRHGHLVLEHETAVTEKGKETTAYKYKLPESIRKHAQELDNALAGIKICDPAIGSGAFPVGLMNEIVTARLVLNSFLQNKDITAYELKRHTIQESIYGVDIDASAIDIARLRLWLSMIVDEEDYESIEALPNLDYKIVCGNSLIGLPKGYEPRWLKKIEKDKQKFFETTDEKEKVELRKKINNSLYGFLENTKESVGYKIDFDFRLFFSEIWHKKDGFDVVIGNPPYVSSKELETNLKNIFKKLFETALGQFDLFSLFIEKSFQINNNRGIHSFIIPDSYMGRSNFECSRDFFIRHSFPKKFLHFNNAFHTATVSSFIYVTSKLKSVDRITFVTANTLDSWIQSHFISNALSLKDLYLSGSCKFVFLSKNDETIIKKIQDGNKKLGTLTTMWRGEEIGRKSDIVQTHPEPNTIRLITGGNAKKYIVDGEIGYIRIEDVKKDINNYRRNKVVIGQLGDNLETAVDLDGLIDTQSVYNIYSTKTNIYVISCLLNSSVLNYLYYKLFKEKKEFPRILLENLKVLPIIDTNEKVQEVLTILYKYTNSLYQNEKRLISSYLEVIIDGIVFELYFTKEFESANKQIMSRTGNLQPISMEMSDEEKLSIIQSEFKRLYDSNHPIRNNLETLDSIEEVRIIKESLKKQTCEKL